MEVFLGIILFFVILYYAFKLFLRYVLPWILARFIRNQNERFSQHYQSTKPEEGEVRIRKNKANRKKDDNGFGEYVDFEDVNE